MQKHVLIFLILLNGFWLHSQTQKDSLKIKREQEALPVISLTDADLEEGGASQDLSGVLQSSKDIFVSTAGYTFGTARFKIRGYSSENSDILINGVPMNDIESGRPYWSVWGGLNDVMRNKEVMVGLVANPYDAPRLGGYTNIIARASLYRKGTKLVYSRTNRSYRNRVMLTHSTGMLKNNMAFTASVSRRWANEGYAPGSFYDAYSYFLAIEKKFTDKHSLNLVVFNAPKRAGSSGFSTQEAYDAAGTNYYNPNWGWQNGKKRNARISTYNQPKLILTDYLQLNRNTQINTSFLFSYAKSGRTKLSWYKADDPRPDYYRHQPYYAEYDPNYDNNAHIYRWSETQGQILWDQFYFTNRNFKFSQENANGSGEVYEGNLANYMLEEEHNDHQVLMLHSVINHSLNDDVNLSGGIDATYYKGMHYKTINDLLGADFWVDIDKFAERMPNGETVKQNDLRIPNHIVFQGDRFGYDYNSIITSQSAFGTVEISKSKIDFFASASVKHNNMYRVGNMQNGKFPDHSLGKSATHNTYDFSLVSGMTYKISGRQYITLNGALLSRSPKFREMYISARTRDQVFHFDHNERVQSYDINYIVRYPRFKSRLTFYHTDFNNSIMQRYMYLDYTNEFVNFLMTDIHTVNTGIEASVEYEVLPGLTTYGVLAKGTQLYQNRPKVNVIVDNDASLGMENEPVYLTGYNVAQGPETVMSLGFKYWAPTYWFAGASFNYLDDMYLGVAQTKHTKEAIDAYEYHADPNTPYYDRIVDKLNNEVLKQEKLKPGYFINAFVGKSWRIDYKYYINLSLNVSNVLDNQEIAVGGFDQYRFTAEHPYKFRPKYFYLYGRQYFLNLSFRF